MSVCEHGQLARSCRVCELEVEVERLRYDIERHMALLTELDNEVEQLRAERADYWRDRGE